MAGPTMVELGRAYGEALCACAVGIEADGYINYNEKERIHGLYDQYRDLLTDEVDRRLMEEYVWNNMSEQTRQMMKEEGWFEWNWG